MLVVTQLGRRRRVGVLSPCSLTSVCSACHSAVLLQIFQTVQRMQRNQGTAILLQTLKILYRALRQPKHGPELNPGAAHPFSTFLNQSFSPGALNRAAAFPPFGQTAWQLGVCLLISQATWLCTSARRAGHAPREAHSYSFCRHPLIWFAMDTEVTLCLLAMRKTPLRGASEASGQSKK